MSVELSIRNATRSDLDFIVDSNAAMALGLSRNTMTRKLGSSPRSAVDGIRLALRTVTSD